MSSQKPCVYYLQGTCVRGESCRFAHPQISQSPAKGCPHFSKGHCRYGDQCRFPHIKDVAPTPYLKKPCVYFSSGRCREGDKCTFLHSPTPLETAFQKYKETASPAPLMPAPCLFFKRGACREGTSCSFAHDLSDVASDELTSSSVPASQRVKPCIYFKQGKCRAGDNCPFSHDSDHKDVQHKSETGSDSPKFPPTKPSQPSIHSTTRSILHSSVKFGAGAQVEKVVTSFESCRVTLHNLPLDTTEADLIDLLSSFSDSASVLIHRGSTPSSLTATINFPIPSEAAMAVTHLHDKTWNSSKMSARLDLRSSEHGALTNRKIKVSWHYHPVRAYGRLFPRKLAESPSESEIDILTSAVRGTLEESGPLSLFNLLPRAPSAKLKFTAFAEYQTATAAESAVNTLTNKPQLYLNGKHLKIEQTFSIKFSIRARQFSTVKAEVDDLTQRSSPTTRIRYFIQNAAGKLADPVAVIVNSSDAKAMGKVKIELEHILFGEVVSVDGKNLWDESFDSFYGQQYIRNINQGAGFFIQYDTRTRTIRLFGNTMERVKARQLINEHLEVIRSQRQVLPLAGRHVKILIEGALDKLKEEFGAEGITLNVVARTLTVQGDAEEVTKTRKALASLIALYSTDGGKGNPTDERLCPVCFCEVSIPEKLDCGHTYCFSCIQHFLKSASDSAASFSSLNCVASIPVPESTENTHSQSCNVPIPYHVIRRLLTSDEETRLLQTSLNSHIHSNPTLYRFCPSADCQVIYRHTSETNATVLNCPSCLVSICSSCNTENHDGLTCAEHKDNLAGGLEALSRWRAAHNVKQCPNCKMDIEKNGGCNHITCFGCKTHICWVCLKTFRTNGGDENIYTHMNREHGGIGLDIPDEY